MTNKTQTIILASVAPRLPCIIVGKCFLEDTVWVGELDYVVVDDTEKLNELPFLYKSVV